MADLRLLVASLAAETSRNRQQVDKVMNAQIMDHNLKAAAMWGGGGRAYDEISRSIAGAIEHCVTRLNPQRGERVADVATGTGWTSRVIARCGAEVVGIDIADGLLAAAREIAREQGLAVDYQLVGPVIDGDHLL